MLHDDGIKLNCGRNAFAYILKAKNIKKIYFPKFMCDSNNQILDRNEIEVVYYSIGHDFKPKIKEWDGWLYLQKILTIVIAAVGIILIIASVINGDSSNLEEQLFVGLGITDVLEKFIMSVVIMK